MKVTIVQENIPEEVVPQRRLGRHVNWDSRSLRYRVAERAVLESQLWQRQIPVFDQGNLGSCTGNAAIGAVGTSPLWSSSITTSLDEETAVAIYSAGTRLDSEPGEYPPTDTGSDGLSVAKACKTAGLISGYTHATSLNEMLSALQTGPVIVGVNWYNSFDNTDSQGLVSLPANASVRGGHEFEVLGMDLNKQLFTCVNSWGAGWGVNGYFYMTFTTMSRLLNEDGDCTQLIPLSFPAPTPAPVPPTPDPTPPPPTPSSTADQDFAAILEAWLMRRPFFFRTVQQGARKWLASKGWPM